MGSKSIQARGSLHLPVPAFIMITQHSNHDYEECLHGKTHLWKYIPSLCTFQVLKSTAEMSEGIAKMESGGAQAGERLAETREQLVNMELKRENLMKHISHLETDIVSKEKEVKKSK